MIVEENFYLPDKPSKLPPSPWLILVPHPDDETFGMGGSILKAKDEGLDVYLVLMTDGSKANVENISRVEEFKNAAKLLGIKEFFNFAYEDRLLSSHKDIIEDVQKILNSKKIKTLFFPSVFEPHPDHRVTASIGWEAARGIKQECDLYSYEISVEGIANYFIDITSKIDEKISIMKTYSSQMVFNDYIEKIVALNRTRTWSMPSDVKYVESFYRFEKKDVDLNRYFFEKMAEFFDYKNIPNSIDFLKLDELKAFLKIIRDINKNLREKENQKDILYEKLLEKSANYERKIETLQSEIQKNLKDIETLKETICNMQNSLSWKITAPLRKIKKMFK